MDESVVWIICLEGNNGWILHQDLGWIFVVPIANTGCLALDE